MDAPAPDHAETRASRPQSVVAALVAAAVGLGAGELFAAFTRSWQSPIEAVADVVIRESPSSVTRFGIDTFGTNDKLALVIGILVLLALAAVAVGFAVRRRRIVGPVAFGLVGLVGVLATAATGDLVDAVPSVVAAVVGAASLDLLVRTAAGRDPIPGVALGATPTRRAFLGMAGAFALVGATAAAAGRALVSRFSAAESRANLVLPTAADRLPAPPATIGFDEAVPFFTSNDDFYRIDTALTVPQVPVEDWTLTVKGMVDEPLELSFEELTTRFEVVERDITLTCVSNPVGGELVDTARWLGVRLADVLDAAGVDPASDQVVGRSTDDYTCGFPVQVAYDNEAIIAFGMNGEPLPLDHGFPARLVTPGLYGYVSATKWLTEIELTTFADFDQYWVPRGYDAEAPIKIMSRMDVPRSGNILDAGPTTIAGVAWAQTRGISKVEVSIDDGPWQAAELATALNDDTWRQWRLGWDATPGAHRLQVRATDGNGELQTQERAEIVPNGTSGWQSRLVTVRAA